MGMLMRRALRAVESWGFAGGLALSAIALLLVALGARLVSSGIFGPLAWAALILLVVALVIRVWQALGRLGR